mgnify:CR=1 FL=1
MDTKQSLKTKDKDGIDKELENATFKAAEQEIDKSCNPDIFASAAAKQAAESLADSIEKKYEKPSTYNRLDYDRPQAKLNAKLEALKDKNYRDPYTGEKLVLRRLDAKKQYGENYEIHMAEADHIEPLKQLHEKHKNDSFTTKNDIKNTGNSKHNLQTINRKLNNVKRARTQSNLAKDPSYLKNKGINLSKKKLQKLDRVGKEAELRNEVDLVAKSAQNAAKTFHEAGQKGMEGAGSIVLLISGVQNIGKVFSGEKELGKAVKDVAMDTGRAMVTGYVTTGSISIATQVMRSSTNSLIKSLGKANAPAAVITTVSAVGDVLYRYVSGEMGATDCLIELQKTGASLVASNVGMGIGQALIPIPIVGAAIGAMVASVAIGFVENVVLSPYYKAKAAEQLAARREEAFRRISGAMESALQAQKSRLDLLEIQEKQNQQEAFIKGMDYLLKASLTYDQDGVAKGLNQVLSYFRKEVRFSTKDEFNRFFDDPNRKPFVL